MVLYKQIAVCAAVCAVLVTGITTYAANIVPSEDKAIVSGVENALTDEIALVNKENSGIDAPVSAENFDAHLSLYDWAKRPLVLPSEFAPKDFDFVNAEDELNLEKTLVIHADKGSEVYAVDDGVVVYANYDNRWNKGYGCFVVVKHAEDLYTLYSHLIPTEESGKELVNIGDTVSAGQCIGLAGTSGNIAGYGVCYGCFMELPRSIKDLIGNIE